MLFFLVTGWAIPASRIGRLGSSFDIGLLDVSRSLSRLGVEDTEIRPSSIMTRLTRIIPGHSLIFFLVNWPNREPSVKQRHFR
jgi:hypothetical protein